MKNVQELMDRLERERFYGSLEIKYEAGKVTIVRKTETLKPSATHALTQCPHNGGAHHGSQR